MVSKNYFVLIAVDLFIISQSNLTVNIAYNKSTTMSSIFLIYNSSFVVDGNLGSCLETDGCGHTQPTDTKPWWMVDLQGKFVVHSVNITNRDLLPERLHSFVIETFSQNPEGCSGAGSVVCLNYTGAGLPTGQTAFTCDQPTRGRFVRISKWYQKSSHDPLTLCEVQIYGTEVNGCDIPQQFRRTPGARLLSRHSKLINHTSLMECSAKCGRETSCLAFNVNVSGHQCELISDGSFENTKDINPGWDYYGSDFC
ncbi:fucolectin-1-like [Gigantopelta aegis]|uniref:fucolectin-1-like n=1 Tax=Gigantopelta aegis TaxID=1735272 RepID=UPI001B88BDEF|nr:fucolectin-1-like [Gigantopelta aegis]